VIGTTVAHYRILEKLGEGGMGVVYRAEDLTLRRQVALKFLTAHALGRDAQRRWFLHEAQAAAALDHSNICPIFAIEEIEDRVFIVMAVAEGDNLKRRLAGGPMPHREATHVALQVAKGLDAAHAEGIVHRDVKSAARLFEQASRAKPEDVQSIVLLGLCYRALGLTERAESTYRASLERGHRHVELNPDDARALYLVAQCHVELGEKEKGLESIRDHPKYVAALASIADDIQSG
jgi:serine/threonine protein kinase